MLRHCATRPFLKHIHQKDSIIRETVSTISLSPVKPELEGKNKTALTKHFPSLSFIHSQVNPHSPKRNRNSLLAYRPPPQIRTVWPRHCSAQRSVSIAVGHFVGSKNIPRPRSSNTTFYVLANTEDGVAVRQLSGNNRKRADLHADMIKSHGRDRSGGQGLCYRRVA